MTIVLTEDSENSRQEHLLSAYIEGRIDVLPLHITSIADDDTEALNKAIARGEEDFAQGRFRTLAEVRKNKTEF